MPRFAANISLLWPELGFPERIAQASAAGFQAVECQFPYAFSASELAERLADHGLVQVLHNLPAGDWAAGERGIACIPGREAEFRDGVGLALTYAQALDVPTLNCLAGLTPPGVPAERVRETLVENLRFAAAALAAVGRTLTVEPLNTRDVPGFHLHGSRQTLELLDQVGADNVRLQYDVYHMQVMEGDLTRTLQREMLRIGHIQIADNPGRGEPGTGEIHFPFLLAAIDAAGYTGWIGCEYLPRTTTGAGLAWFDPYRP
ncbi:MULTISPECIES: hydroxypyruvate isomerase [unclassified Xanthobacter]|uniref:hydroxypyruvate isomerase n=1 Tax=unclassified Xanthobacter TaxID=2623496 RepID=UPI001EE0331D|nr:MULTISPECIES: hydroxypyruvate isomerase [unclassified Xanthobacter]